MPGGPRRDRAGRRLESPLKDGPRSRSIVDLAQEDLVRTLLLSPSLDLIGLFVLAALGWAWLTEYRAIAAMVTIALLALPIARFCTLSRLSKSGVELTADLAGVEDDQGAETDFRTARYLYQLDGQQYEFTVIASDFFMPLASRFGPRIHLLVDPHRPRTAVFMPKAWSPGGG
jgi:hypothetical protein